MQANIGSLSEKTFTENKVFQLTVFKLVGLMKASTSPSYAEGNLLRGFMAMTAWVGVSRIPKTAKTGSSKFPSSIHSICENVK